MRKYARLRLLVKSWNINPDRRASGRTWVRHAEGQMKCFIKVCNKFRTSASLAEAAQHEILEIFMSLPRRLVAQKRHISLDLIHVICFFFFKLVIYLVVSTLRRTEHWLCHDSSWLRQSENPRTAPSSGLPRIRASHRSPICISSSEFLSGGLSSSKPSSGRLAALLCARLHLQSNTRGDQNVQGSSWIMLPKILKQGNWRYYFGFRMILLRSDGSRHVSFG